ncbi:TonB family protein [Nitrosococcus halophilus Nc 4]|uniref:TonB family protein n=1 Tax=Nitrosococcus halophilus (strain Nc4) TaxID=472759 RepID=D5C4Z5_NITHN|nr:energy transducer TonB [Nitrosococcus halophilus]ADE13418.1 TonB family protein [Nitrosococcus halophilus Nc 4]
MSFTAFTIPTMSYRLGLALLLSALLHGAAILSIGQLNILPPPTPVHSPPLEIVLVPIKQEQAPEKPDFLAQANHIGGSLKEKQPPRPTPPSPPPASKPLQTASNGTTQPSGATLTEKKLPPPEPVTTPSVLTQKHASRPVTQQASEPEPLDTVEVEDSPKPRPSARELIAALEGQLAKEIQGYANQPRKRHIDSSTKEYAATAYLDAWRKKIERVGKMNYPEEAKRQGLSGSLILVVDLNVDGSVANIVVRRSSGYQILDEAAIRIVRLAAPFAKVPENLLQGHDILSITRTWQFHSGIGVSP